MATSDNLVLVTGASGFIGAHIVQQLLAEGYRVRGTLRDLNDSTKTGPLKRIAEGAAYPLELVQADLLDVDCWKDVVKGCRFVLHVACPWPSAEPKCEDDVIKPAVKGTLNVLKAAAEEHTVKRFVLTSSGTAIINGYNYDSSIIYTEQNFTNPNNKNIGIHGKSKALAEKALWAFMTDHKDALETKGFSVTVLNLGIVIGPALNKAICHMMVLNRAMLKGEWPMTTRLNASLIDVRDVAKAHLVAMTSCKSANQRYIVTNGNLWLKEVAEFMNTLGYNVSTREAPYALFALICMKDKRLKMLQPAFGKELKMDNSKMKRDLIHELIPLEQSMRDMVQSMKENGLID